MHASLSAQQAAWTESHRRTPFLMRNIEQGSKGQMGSILSAARAAITDTSNESSDSDALSFEDRPKKRQRLADVPQVNERVNGQSRIQPKPALPKSKPKRKFKSDAFQRLAENYKATRSADQVLQIDVRSIVEKYENDQPSSSTQPLGKVKVKCFLSIDSQSDYGGQWGLPAGKVDVILFRASQNGYIETTFKDGRPAVTDVVLPGPFFVPAEQLSVNRPVLLPGPRKGQFGYNNNAAKTNIGHGLAENYTVSVWFETMGAQSTWPPLELATHPEGHTIMADALRQGAPLHLVRLYGEMPLFDNPDEDREMPLEMKLAIHSHDTPYSIKTRVTWASVTDEKPKMAQIESKAPDVPIVTWLFPTIGVRDDVTDVDHIILTGFECAICHRRIKSSDVLQTHLHTEHSEYVFDVSQSAVTQQWLISYYMQLPVTDSEDEHSTSEDLFLTTTVQPSDFYGTGTSNRTKRSLKESRPRIDSTTPSYSSSLPTTLTTPEPVIPKSVSKLKPSLVTRPKLATCVVPTTKKPLYHTQTRRILVPGEPLSPPTKRASDAWRQQEHRDIINDFSDFLPEEKDYMIHWDTFIGQQGITADCYLSEAMIRFVKINCTVPTAEDRGPDAMEIDESEQVLKGKCWFAERHSRARMWGLHATALQLREVISANDLWTCTKMIGEACPLTPAPSAGADVEMEIAEAEIEARKSHIIRGGTDCFCGKHVLPFGALFCAAKGCEFKFHHKACVLGSESAIAPRGWLCDKCESNSNRDKGKGREKDVAPLLTTSLPQQLRDVKPGHSSRDSRPSSTANNHIPSPEEVASPQAFSPHTKSRTLHTYLSRSKVILKK